jgi:hypothetical protein
MRPIRLTASARSCSMLDAMTRPDQSDRRIPVGNSQMTRQEILDALEANVIFAKDGAADLLRYLRQVPPRAEQAHVVHEVQRVQGYLGGLILQLVRALREDEQQRQRLDHPPKL